MPLGSRHLRIAALFELGEAGVHTFTGVILRTAGTRFVIAYDAAAVTINGLAPVTVVAAPAVAFELLVPSSVPSGTSFDVTVIAVDAYGNIDTNYRGTVAFAATDPDPGVVLPPNFTFESGDAGTATFSGAVTLFTTGDPTLTVTDLDSGITGSITVTIA